ncbi:MAG TPA: PilN domain-containing protein, partial [Chthonomonadales bacterium]|nr:PilN domain-containing protein [Chthonomonadales bacterium]
AVDRCLPKNIWLTHLLVDRAATVTIRGETRSPDAATNLVLALQESGRFDLVRLTYLGDVQDRSIAGAATLPAAAGGGVLPGFAPGGGSVVPGPTVPHGPAPAGAGGLANPGHAVAAGPPGGPGKPASTPAPSGPLSGSAPIGAHSLPGAPAHPAPPAPVPPQGPGGLPAAPGPAPSAAPPVSAGQAVQTDPPGRRQAKPGPAAARHPAKQSADIGAPAAGAGAEGPTVTGFVITCRLAAHGEPLTISNAGVADAH